MQPLHFTPESPAWVSADRLQGTDGIATRHQAALRQTNQETRVHIEHWGPLR